MNPYLVLDLPLEAGDAEVRAAYQDLLRRYPPELRPEGFQLVQEAYEKLRTGRDRWQWRLLHVFVHQRAWRAIRVMTYLQHQHPNLSSQNRQWLAPGRVWVRQPSMRLNMWLPWRPQRASPCRL